MAKPQLNKIVPVFGINSYEGAVAHYVDWLGFNLDWEWREAEGEPVIMAISRDGLEFMLNEHPDSPSASTVTVHVANLEELAADWDAKRPGEAIPTIELPYEFATLRLRDPSGNALSFHETFNSDEQRKQNGPKMRAYIQKKLDAGEPFPTPEEVREAVGPSLGVVIEILNEFPGYGEAHKARKEAKE